LQQAQERVSPPRSMLLWQPFYLLPRRCGWFSSVIAASVTAVIVNDWWLNQGPSLPVHDVQLAPLAEAPLYLIMGLIVGAMGSGFNFLVIHTVRAFGEIRRRHWLMLSVMIGGVIGAFLWFSPLSVGGGESLIAMLVPGQLPLAVILGLFMLRSLTTSLSYGAGVPGGIFAPMLALGTLAGVLFGFLAKALLPSLVSTPAEFAVAAMGALFAATVGAPLTGIVLVTELTGAHEAILAIIVTCLSATLVSRALGARPLYTQLLNLALQSGSTMAPSKE
jgi:H+/Cl- antiporter ClcA